jgi:hypothetical protein
MSNKTCCICYNNNINDNLKCKICKNEVCDDCYSNIIFNNQVFMPNFILDNQLYNCPYCKTENNFNTNINNFNINNKLIKLLIFKLNKNNINYNNLVDELNNLRNYRNEILNDNNDLENQINNLRKFNFELIKKNKELNNQLNNVNIDLKQTYNNITLELEYKPQNEKLEKLEKIENLIKSTKKNTILYNQINDILNK